MPNAHSMVVSTVFGDVGCVSKRVGNDAIGNEWDHVLETFEDRL